MHLVSDDVNRYAQAYSSPESEVLKELREKTYADIEIPEMLSGHLQGRALSLFSKLVEPKTILEIGTYTGYSAICLAEGLQSDGMLHTIDIDPEMSALARTFFDKAGVAERITAHTGVASEVLEALPGPFELVFIDADKENYSNYFDLVIDKVSKAGIIIADNVLWSGHVLDQEKDEETAALHAYNIRIQSDQRVENVLLPVRDGLMVARKN